MKKRDLPPSIRADEELASFTDGDQWLERLRMAEESPPLGFLGRYELREVVSRGGQGVVYRAWDTRAARSVALKRMIAGALSSAATRQRFEREIETAAALSHPGVVTVYSVETLEEQAILAMEWIDGVPIDHWARVEGKARPCEEIVEMVLRVAEALRHAHQRGVLHRDLKPSNILVGVDGNPRLLDFGLATFLPSLTEAESLTRTGQFLGTPAWCSPEQVRGGRSALDVRSDLYSLGVVFYAALTGEMPYPVEGSLATAFQSIQHEDPKRPTQIRRDVPVDLEAVVLKALEKNPDDRYQSVDAFAEDLRKFSRGEAVSARAHDFRYVLAKSVRRHRSWVAAGAGLLGLLAVFAVTMTVLFNRADAEAERALRVQQFLQTTLLPGKSGSELMGTRMVDVLAQASERIDTELEGHPDLEARLWETLAFAYSQLWMWGEVVEPARRGHALLAELEGERSERAINLLHLLGTAMTFQEDPGAFKVTERSLELRLSAVEPEPLAIAGARAALAFAAWRSEETRNTQRAEEEYHQALEIYDREGEANIQHAGARYGYAALLQMLERDEEAIEMYESALAIYRQVPTADAHMRRCQQNFGRLLYHRGEFERAEPHLRTVLDRSPLEDFQRMEPLLLWELADVRERAGDAIEARDLRTESLASNLANTPTSHDEDSHRLRSLVRRIRREGLTSALASEIEVIHANGAATWYPSWETYLQHIDRF